MIKNKTKVYFLSKFNWKLNESIGILNNFTLIMDFYMPFCTGTVPVPDWITQPKQKARSSGSNTLLGHL